MKGGKASALVTFVVILLMAVCEVKCEDGICDLLLLPFFSSSVSSHPPFIGITGTKLQKKNDENV